MPVMRRSNANQKNSRRNPGKDRGGRMQTKKTLIRVGDRVKVDASQPVNCEMPHSMNAPYHTVISVDEHDRLTVKNPDGWVESGWHATRFILANDFTNIKVGDSVEMLYANGEIGTRVVTSVVDKGTGAARFVLARSRDEAGPGLWFGCINGRGVDDSRLFALRIIPKAEEMVDRIKRLKFALVKVGDIAVYENTAASKVTRVDQEGERFATGDMSWANELSWYSMADGKCEEPGLANVFAVFNPESYGWVTDSDQSKQGDTNDPS